MIEMHRVNWTLLHFMVGFRRDYACLLYDLFRIRLFLYRRFGDVDGLEVRDHPERDFSDPVVPLAFD